MFQSGIQFGYQPVMPKKKEDEQMMSSMFPGLDENQSQWVINEAKKQTPKDATEEIKIQNDIYRQALPIVKEREAKEARMKAKNEFFNASFDEKDLQQAKLKVVQLKVEDLADMIKDKYNLIPTAPTEGIIQEFGKLVQDKGIDPQLVQDYIDGKSDELLYQTELKARPVENDTNSIFKAMPGDALPSADPINPYTGDEELGEYIGGLATNIPGSTWNILAGLGNIAIDITTSPFKGEVPKTLKSIVKLVSGAGANAGIAGISAITGKDKEAVKAKMFNEWNPVYTYLRDKLGIDMAENEQMADAMGGFFVDRYGGWEQLKKTIKEDPVGIIGDFISVIEGGATLAAKAGLISKAQKASILNNLAKADPYIQVPSMAVKGTIGAVKGASKGFTNLAEATMNKITAIDKEDRVFARKNPELVNAFVDGTKSVDDVAGQLQSKFDELTDIRKVYGKGYEDIRKGGAVADTSKVIDDARPILSDKGIQISEKGELVFDKFSKFNEPQKKAITQAWKIVQDVGSEGQLNSDQILNLRQKIDDLINWEGKPMKASTVDREAENMIRNFRKIIDEKAKNIPGLEDLDRKFSPLIDDINTVKKDRFNTDGTLKDNTLSKLKNLTNDANKARLTRLEKVMPGITEQVRALKVGLAVDGAMKSRVGQYAQQMLLGGGVISVFTNPALILPLMGAGIVLTPKNIIKTLQFIGRSEIGINKIIDKIRGGIKLLPEEEAKVGNLIKKNEGELPNIAEDLQLNKKDVIPENTSNNTTIGLDDVKQTNKIDIPATPKKYYDEVGLETDIKGNVIAKKPEGLTFTKPLAPVKKKQLKEFIDEKEFNKFSDKQKELYNHSNRNYEQLKEEFIEKISNSKNKKTGGITKHNPNYVNPDDWRDIIDPYANLTASEQHGIVAGMANRYADDIITKFKLENPGKQIKAKLIFGGPGSGKSRSLYDEFDYDIIFDKVAPVKELQNIVDMGGVGTIEGVYATLDEASVSGVKRLINQNVDKGLGKGRATPLSVQVMGHKKFLEKFSDLMNKGDIDSWKIQAIDNRGHPVERKIIDLKKDLAKVNEDMLGRITSGNYSQKEAIDIANEAFKKGEITKTQLTTTLSSLAILFGIFAVGNS